MENPLVYLVKKMWQYSEGNRRSVVTYFLMSVCANLLIALDPLVVGVFLNTLQTQGLHKNNLLYLFMILGLLPLLELSFWALHGPSRTIENANAFMVRRNYKNFLLSGTMALPLEWHTDHHSGDTIDKIEKGSTALFNFSERTFEVTQGVIALVTAFGVMIYFDAVAGLVAFAITLL